MYGRQKYKGVCKVILSSKGHKGCLFEHVPPPLQHYSDCPSGERGNGEPQRPSGSSLTLSQLVRAKSSAGMEDERMLCESLNSSASNSQQSLTGLQSSAFPAHPPRNNPMVPRQPNWRVRAKAHFHPCFRPRCLPCFFPSHLFTPCLSLLSNALLSAGTLSFLVAVVWLCSSSSFPTLILTWQSAWKLFNTAALLKDHKIHSFYMNNYNYNSTLTFLFPT